MRTIVDFKVSTADLEQFCQDQAQRHNDYIDRALNGNRALHGRAHKFTIGPRYARIIRTDSKYDTSVVCFIDLTNGDILKGSWKAPVKKGVRGNIFTEDRGASVMNQYGCAYLR